MAKMGGYTLLIILSLIWGNAFVAIRYLVYDEGMSPVNLTVLRWSIVSLGFLAIYPLVIKPTAKFERKDFPRLLLVSLTSVVIYHLALNSAERTVSASLAGLLISLAPLTTVLLSTVLLHERVGGRLWLAVVLAIAGSVVLSSRDLSLAGTASGPLLVVASAVSSGTYTVASKPLVGKYGPFAVAAWSAFVGTAVLLPLASGSLLQQAEGLSGRGWASVLYLALLSTVLANLIYFTLVARQPVSRLAPQLYLVPVVSAIGGILILGESVYWSTLLGGSLLLVAIGLAATVRR